MEGVQKQEILEKLRTFKIATALLIAVLFTIKTVEMIMQAKYNAQRFLVKPPRGVDCCHPLQMSVKSLQFIY
jgi:hypothetical protein